MQRRPMILHVSAIASKSIMVSPCIRASSSEARTAEVWRLAKTGNIAGLKMERQQMTPVQQKELRVDVRAVRPSPTDHRHAACVCVRSRASYSDCTQVGVNFADVFTCLGLYQAAPKAQVVPGLEVSRVASLLAASAFATSGSADCCVLTATSRLLSLQAW